MMPVNGWMSHASSSTGGRAALVGFSETLSGVGARPPAFLKPRGGGARDTDPEYDRAFEATAWWSSTDDGGNSEGRSPLDPFSEEESDAASNPQKEMLEP